VKQVNRHLHRNVLGWLTVLTLVLTLPVLCHSAVLYRSYIVKYDRGWDILCDPYIVQKDDWVYKIFRQKGEISSRDFREFLSIFKRLNEHIHDIDRVRPNQRILIPLKKLEPGTLPGQSSGVVTIPFVSISKVSEILESYSKTYAVKNGDSVSKLIAKRFGNFGTRSYKEGLNLFKTLNPNITNLDVIYVGQNLVLPDPAMQNEPWYHSLFDNKGNVITEKNAGKAATPNAADSTPVEKSQENTSPLSKTASILDARLLDKGTYFFPRQSGQDFELDLSKFPVIEMENGKRVVFKREGEELGVGTDVLKSRWKNVEIVNLPKDTSIEQMLGSVFSSQDKQIETNGLSFSDHGLNVTVRSQWVEAKPADEEGKIRHICITMIEDTRQRTPDPIARYLDWHGIVIRDVLKGKPVDETASPQEPGTFVLPDVITLAPTDRKTFVADLIEALGYDYSRDISVTFPYAGIQITAVSNMVSMEDGHDFLVDFGELYGDAAREIQKTGLGMVQITRQDSLDEIIIKLLTSLGIDHSDDPLFTVAARPAEFNTVLKVPGYLVSRSGDRDVLLSAVPLHNRVLQFLNQREVKVILTGLMQNL